MQEAAMIILYDGICGLCNRLVQFVLKRDRRKAFRFAPLQGDFARELLTRHGQNPDDLDTMWLILDPGTPQERLMRKGKAAMRVLRELGGGWRILSWLSFLPAPLLDFGYDIIANNRYKWFGKKDACPLPTPEQRARFIGL